MNDDNQHDYYTDEPIGAPSAPGADAGARWTYVAPAAPQPASVAPWERSARAAGDAAGAPEGIRRLVHMMDTMPWTVTRNKAFYLQAKAMADFADDAPIVPFQAYYPVYRDMSVAQLRSYFTLRHYLRLGRHPELSPSYLYVYIYELLMQIGTGTPEKGLELLEELLRSYDKTFPTLRKHLSAWLRDYVVYYHLDDHRKDYFAREIEDDTDAIVLSNYAKADDRLLFATAVKTSTYHVRDGVLFKQAPDDMAIAGGRAFRAAAPIWETRTHNTIDRLCLGFPRQESVAMFASAVFYNPEPVRNATFAVTPRRAYTCRSGLWMRDTFQPDVLFRRGELIGKVLRETDRLLRLALNVKPKLRPTLRDAELEAAVRQAVGGWLHEKAEAARPKVTVDFTRLDRIRKDADVVRDALLGPLSADAAPAAEPSSHPAAPPPVEATAANQPQPAAAQPSETSVPQPQPSGLRPSQPSGAQPEQSASAPQDGRAQHLHFLHLLLTGGDWAQYLRDIHKPLGVITEEINGEAMDTIGDIVIDDDGSGPTIIDDYRDDIEQMIAQPPP